MELEFTLQAEKVMEIACEVSDAMKYSYVGTEHLLLALAAFESGVAYRVLKSNGVERQKIQDIINDNEDLYSAKIKGDRYSNKLKEVLELSELEAKRFSSKKIASEHLLIGLIKCADCMAVKMLMTMSVNIQKIFLETFVSCGVDMNTAKKEFAIIKNPKTRKATTKTPTLDQFSKNLIEQAHADKMDPVIGREREIERIMQILCRRMKNNPCLVGEPGVGKTAIVEGLAKLISDGSVPDLLLDKKIVSLDLSGMVAGSKYRGEFEERIKKVIAEVKAAGNIILYVDELHTIIGAGGAEGAIDASNILKPALSRGEVQMIGATTRTEYRKYIEKDAALERRFQPVSVEEPTKEETITILNGLKSKYENHHKVTISDEAIKQAVELSIRYINDRYLPDKAIDLIDEASSRKKLGLFTKNKPMIKAEEKVKMLETDLENALYSSDFDAASEIKKELVKANKKLSKAKNDKIISDVSNVVVTDDDVADVVSVWTKISVSKISMSESSKLLKLEEILHNRVVAQDEAVKAVAKAIRRGRVGLKDPKRPTGSFLFLGPTGVGKTELSKALAEALFGSENSLIRVDMSEYMEKHSVSKMIGSPPGYVGFEEGGQLAEKVRKNPYSVILFDEIEKAHPDVFNVLLQVLDDGRITDSQGRFVDFKNTIIIMTSNAGAQKIIDPKTLGFSSTSDEKQDHEKMKKGVMEEIKNIFKPEFINRIDDIIVFKALLKDDIKEISSLMLKELKNRVKAQMDITITYGDTLKNFIFDKGYDKKYGARPLKRTIQNEIEDKLAEEILSGNVKAGDKVSISVSDDKVLFKVAQ